jgi:hypothetical protein
MKDLWLDYFGWVLQSEGKALATLELGVTLSELKTIKTFILHLAAHRRSNLQLEGITGWSYNTTTKAVSAMFGMVSLACSDGSVMLCCMGHHSGSSC